MKEKKTVWLSTFRYVVPADYENWLETLAMEGWTIDKIKQWDSLRMVFHRSSPQKYRYVFDLNAFAKKDYFTTYQQFGWEYMGQMASCYIWRQPYTDERPESFSDIESLRQRNRRVFWGVFFSFAMAIVSICLLLIGFFMAFQSFTFSSRVAYVSGLLFLAVFAGYLGWVLHKVHQNRYR